MYVPPPHPPSSTRAGIYSSSSREESQQPERDAEPSRSEEHLRADAAGYQPSHSGQGDVRVRHVVMALAALGVLLYGMVAGSSPDTDPVSGDDPTQQEAPPVAAEDAALTEAEKCEQLIAMDSEERIAFIQERLAGASDYEAAETAKGVVIACPAWTGTTP